MLLIRTFEEALLQRHDHGFQLLSSGQEAVAVGLCAALQPGDPLLASGRSIGAALARGVEPRRVMAELLGKATGPCGGRGGRGHLAQPSAGFFGALALQLGGGADVVACIFGDGACGGGALHETLNLAALWRLPLLLVCDNNGYSVSTPRSEALAPKRLADLALAFGVPGRTVDGMDVLAVESAAVAFATLARSGGGPAFLECVSQRFASHSTAARETRSAAELLAARASCPILRLQQRLEAEGILSVERRAELEREVRSRVEEALRFADASPYPDPSALVHDGL